jgi:TetR/AcrR family transcriptional repressor of lmrAB and yxaGH operons
MLNQLTRDIFIQQTCELLGQTDRNDMPLSVLLASCNAKKGSLYHFFPNGKDELVVAAVEHLSACAQSRVGRCLAGAGSVSQAVYKQLLDLAKWMDTQGPEFAIPFTAIVAITGAENEEVRIACERALQAIERMYVRRLKTEGVSPKEARSLAQFLVASTEGAFLMARTTQSSKSLRSAASHLRQYLVDRVDS